MRKALWLQIALAVVTVVAQDFLEQANAQEANCQSWQERLEKQPFHFAEPDAGVVDVPRHEFKKRSLAEDLKLLHGTWLSDANAKQRLELRINVVEREGGALEASALYLPMAYQAPSLELKDTGAERLIVHKNPAPTLGLTSVPYRFDGDSLILTISQGSLKGEHRLTRVKSALNGIVLTPETMARHEFHVTCRFTDQPLLVKGTGNAPPDGLTGVHVAFDAEKGPAISKFQLAGLVLRDGDAIMLAAPLQLSQGADRKAFRHVSFVIDKKLLPKAELTLTGLGFNPPPSFRVDLAAFHKATR